MKITELPPEGSTPEESENFLERLFAAPDASPEEIVQIKEAIAKLPHKYCIAFILSYVYGFSESEAADVMGCSIEQFRGYKYRAREILQQMLKP